MTSQHERETVEGLVEDLGSLYVWRKYEFEQPRTRGRVKIMTGDGNVEVEKVGMTGIYYIRPGPVRSARRWSLRKGSHDDLLSNNGHGTGTKARCSTKGRERMGGQRRKKRKRDTKE